MARVPLPDARELAETLPELAAEMRLGSLNVVRAMGNNPELLAAATSYVEGLYALLPATTREVVILAVARETDSEYEWHQHVRIARDEGVPGATIRAIGAGDHDALEADERALVEFVRAQCRGEVMDETFAALAEHLPTEDVVVVSRLAANYAGTADFIAAMDVPLEGDFVGWVPEG